MKIYETCSFCKSITKLWKTVYRKKKNQSKVEHLVCCKDCAKKIPSNDLFMP